MTRSNKLVLLAFVLLVGAFSVGASGALAHGGPGRGFGGASAAALVTEAAEQLNVTRARLVDAIGDAAQARIDEAVTDGDVESEDAAELKSSARGNVRYAMAIARTRVVAANLSITTTALNNGFRAARKAVALARVDEALEDGDIEPAEATELKAEINARTYPGFKGSLGFGRRHG